MREVIPGQVWIGNARDAQEFAAVLAAEIGAVVQLAMEEPSVPFPREIIYCRFPLLDGSGNPPVHLRIAIQTVAMFIESKVPVLVACSGGMSRSPAVVAGAIAYATNRSPDECLKKIAAAGPHDVAPGFWNEIRALVGTE